MPSLNVYVSEDLKRQMDKHKDVNWSSICQSAIVTVLADREHIRELTIMREEVSNGKVD